MNENTETNSEIFSEEIIVSDTENIIPPDTENLESVTGTLVDSDSSLAVLTNISNDVHLILVFVILSFAMSCMRGWRKNTLKGV